MAVECPSSPRDPGKTEDIPARRLAGADVRDAPPDPADVPSPSLATGPRLAGTALLVAGLATLAAATILSDGAPALDSRRVLVDVFENRTEELELLLAEHPDDPWVLLRGAQLRAQQGRREAALEFIDRFVEVTGRAGAGLEVAALLGDRETAMHRLREIEQTQGIYRPWLRHTPLLDSLRDYPPFQEFVRPKG